MLLIARALKNFRDRNPGVSCRVTNAGSNAMQYAGHAGFFSAFGLPWANQMGAAAASSNFLPVTARTVSDLFAGQPMFRAAGDIIQEDAERLAGVLVQRNSGELFDALRYTIRELLRNVVEHSKSDTFYFAGQCWPAAGKAEIAIADAGIGITQALTANGKYRVDNDGEALALATSAGVSGAIIPKHSDNVWANSGYGLYMARGLADGAEGLLLASGTAALIGGNGNQRVVEGSFEGTCVALRLQTNELSLEDRLRSLRDESGGRASGASMSARVK